MSNQVSTSRGSSEQRFTFIVQSSHTGQVDAETRRQVHSHAQANYRRRISNRRGQNVAELDVTPLLERPMRLHTDNPTVCSGPLTILDASRSDPFEAFPLPGGQRAHRLWDHVYDGTCAKFRVLIAIGFIDLVRQSIALSQMLSASAWHLVHFLRSENDTGDDAKYSLISTRALQQRLADIVTGTTDEVITAVLAAAAYANLTKLPHLFQTHVEGLSQIIRHRGGENTLDTCPALRLAMFWWETVILLPVVLQWNSHSLGSKLTDGPDKMPSHCIDHRISFLPHVADSPYLQQVYPSCHLMRLSKTSEAACP